VQPTLITSQPKRTFVRGPLCVVCHLRSLWPAPPVVRSYNVSPWKNSVLELINDKFTTLDKVARVVNGKIKSWKVFAFVEAPQLCIGFAYLVHAGNATHRVCQVRLERAASD
jgi:hypothetical protein